MPKKSGQGRVSLTLLVAMVVVAIGGFSIICILTLIEMRRGAWEMARQVSENLAATIDADISRNIDLYDLSMRAVASNILLPEVATVSKSLRHLVLFDHAATARHFGPLQVLNSTGDLVLDASTLDPAQENRSGKNYFIVHQKNAEAGLFIGEPAADERGEYSIHLSRRISNADGSFWGVVVGSIKVSYFHDLFRRLSLGSEDAMTLMNKQGIVIMRTPFEIDMIGKDLSQGKNVRRVLVQPSGWFEGEGAIDGSRRLYVWKWGSSPLLVLPGRSLDSLYAAWRGEAAAIAAAIALLIIMMTGITAFLLAEMRKRTHLQNQLASLAATDALTGLANRRQFDKSLHDEWQRGNRQKTPLALLMVDADNFKCFNDMFGHQAGDRLLAAIAECIRENARRSSDCAARYGGEEFGLILPGATEIVAHEIAERIRVAVENLPAEAGKATVSIGVISVVPNRAMSAADVLKAADEALYAAKKSGRNRTQVSLFGRPRLIA